MQNEINTGTFDYETSNFVKSNEIIYCNLCNHTTIEA